MSRPHDTPGRQLRRSGAALYSLVVSLSLIVSLLGLAALTVTRIERRAAGRKHELAEARRYAQAAVELGLVRIQNDVNWRTTYTSGVWEANQPLGSGTYTLEGIDTVDADLANSPTDPLVLIGSGVSGQAVQKIQVTLVHDPQPLSCLNVALHAGTYLNFNTGTFTGDQILSANNAVNSSGATVNSDVEAVNAINGGTYGGATTTGIAPRQMPNPNTLFNYYQTNGTAISIYDLPTPSQVSTIQDTVLSPNSNPYGPGTTDPQGIYVIDCLGTEIRVRNCRIVGTLVLLNTGSGSYIGNSVHWEPAVANYPALLVDGNIEFKFNTATLNESNAAGTNFNPPGTPYLDVSDTDSVDSYPSLIRGLVYVSGDATSINHPTFDGVVIIGASLTTSSVEASDITLTYQSTFLNDPPPGFTGAATMKISPGSWRRKVD